MIFHEYLKLYVNIIKHIHTLGPVIDLRLERHNRLIKREYDRVLDQVLALSTMQGSRLTSEALIILVNGTYHTFLYKIK